MTSKFAPRLTSPPATGPAAAPPTGEPLPMVRALVPRLPFWERRDLKQTAGADAAVPLPMLHAGAPVTEAHRRIELYRDFGIQGELMRLMATVWPDREYLAEAEVAREREQRPRGTGEEELSSARFGMRIEAENAARHAQLQENTARADRAAVQLRIKRDRLHEHIDGTVARTARPPRPSVWPRTRGAPTTTSSSPIAIPTEPMAQIGLPVLGPVAAWVTDHEVAMQLVGGTFGEVTRRVAGH